MSIHGPDRYKFPDTQRILKDLASGDNPAAKLRTILGGDIEHVYRERKRLRPLLAAHKGLAEDVFGKSDVFFGKPGSLSGQVYQLRDMVLRGMREGLTEDEETLLNQEYNIATKQPLFRQLIEYEKELIKQREITKREREGRPGRTQTILTRREG